MASKGSSAKSKRAVPVWIWAVIGLFVVAAVAAFAFLPGLLEPQAATLPNEVSAAQAFQLREEGAFVLDVRTPAEWEESHVPGATLIPLDELESRLDEVPVDREVVVMCRSGNRSATGRDILRQAGFVQVTSMAGGIQQWGAAGYPLE
jgi:rhodanese-related sulfurtransferase